MKINISKPEELDGSNIKIAIVLPYFNDKLGIELYENTIKELKNMNIKEKNISLTRVAGALEIPFACQKISNKQKPNCIIALGIVIKGETNHFELVCENTYQGIMKTQLKTGIPIIFGVQTCKNKKQAIERVSQNGQNKGKQIAISALIQANL